MKNLLVLSILALSSTASFADLTGEGPGNVFGIPKEVFSEASRPEFQEKVTLPASLQKACDGLRTYKPYWDVMALDIQKSVASIPGMERKEAMAHFDATMSKFGFSKQYQKYISIADAELVMLEHGPASVSIALNCATGVINYQWVMAEKTNDYVHYIKYGWKDVDVSVVNFKGDKAISLKVKNAKAQFVALDSKNKEMSDFVQSVKLKSGWNTLDFSLVTTSKKSFTRLSSNESSELDDSFDSRVTLSKDGKEFLGARGDANLLFFTKMSEEGDEMFYDTTNDIEGLVAGLKELKAKVKINGERLTYERDTDSFMLDFSKDAKNSTFVRIKN